MRKSPVNAIQFQNNLFPEAKVNGVFQNSLVLKTYFNLILRRLLGIEILTFDKWCGKLYK